MLALQQKSVCFFVILLLCAVWRAEGRYLPTRSDSSRYEHIKEILRALMDLNESESHSGRQNYMYDDVLRSKRATADLKIQDTVVA